MFQFKPNWRKQNLLGLDIGSQAIKCVRLAKKNDKKTLAFCGVFKTPGNEADLVGQLGQFLKENALTGLPTAASIDDPSLKIHKIELPPMPEADLKEAVRWKMRDVVDGSIDDYVVRYSHMSESDPAKTKHIHCVGYAIKKTSIKHYQEILKKCSLKPEIIEPAAVSLARASEETNPSGDEWLATVDLGNPLLIICGRGKFCFSRPLPSLKNLSFSHDDYPQKLAAEIQNALDTFIVTFKVEKIKKILLSGEPAGKEKICDYLTTNLGIETRILDPLANMQIPDGLKNMGANQPFIFARAVGLASIYL